ncbi:MAG: M15 family metallopeptidase [Ignavibacteriae bacterium]|nr:M15 family metallopeptidase [Ignavibacteriota bacterium]
MKNIKYIFIIFTSLLTNFYSQTKSSELVPIKDLIPNIIIELKYATTDNFFEQKLYASNECYVLKELADKLIFIQDSLNKLKFFNGKSFPKGIGLKIWDGYRPRSVQYTMFEIFPDPTFVADPKSGSTHNRGGAVDLTLVDLNNGEEFNMPTGFDDFSDAAAHDYPSDLLTYEQFQNREFIKKIMTEVGGLDLYSAEWWHYQLINNKDFPLLDFQVK